MVESNFYERKDEGKPYEYKPVKEVKSYAMRLKRHTDSILALYSPQGISGNHLITSSADEKFRIWDMKENSMSELISFERPPDSQIMKYGEMGKTNLNEETKNQSQKAEEHDNAVLSGLPKRSHKYIPTCISFCDNMILSGYEDGLIFRWELEGGNFGRPMLGHSNRVNYIYADESQMYVFSASNDCTIREWNVQTGICENVYKFADPITVIRLREDLN